MNLFTAFIFTLGAGVCSDSGDWCAEPVGHASAEVIIAEQGRHAISSSFQHFSDIDDKYDNGADLFLLEYKYTIRR